MTGMLVNSDQMTAMLLHLSEAMNQCKMLLTDFTILSGFDWSLE